MLIGIACEDDGHFSAATRLIDDALLEQHGQWLDGVIDSCRSRHGIRDDQNWYKYDPDDAHDLRPLECGGRIIRPHGAIDGSPLKPEAGMWRKVLMLFAYTEPRPEVVVLVRDLDGYLDRRSGLEQVRDGLPWPFAIVAATPEPEIEAWRVAGFVAKDSREETLLEEVRRELSFDPTTESHRLTSHPNDKATDAKRVLSRLCGHDRERLDECLADRELLRSRGEENGASAFLTEVDQHIVPKLGPARQSG